MPTNAINHENEDQEIQSSSALGELLDAVRNGDPSAERALFYEYSGKLIRLAAARISEIFKSKFDAEDIVQSVFKSFFSKNNLNRLQFETEKDIWSLLVCMTIRKCNQKLKYYLRDKRNVNRESTASTREDGRESQIHASPAPTPLQIAMFNESLERLLGPMNELQRQIIAMKIQGLSTAEIGEKINRTERTVYRALSILREQIKEMSNSL